MAVLGDELWRADVGNEKCMWRVFSCDCIGGRQIGIDNGSPLAADAQGESIAFSRACQVAVDGYDIWMAACERGHEDGVT